MKILRRPDESEDDAPPKNNLLRFFVLTLILVAGMAVFFVGGLVVRNQWLPTYLVDQIVRRFQGANPAGRTTPGHTVGAAENQKPPPPPTTADEYLNLMSYASSACSAAKSRIFSRIRPSTSS